MGRKLVLLVLLCSGLALTACNTVQGLGQDIESVGRAGKRAM